ncbi:MAG: hypothetical protein ACFBWO_08845 [Paracoccaceae bacterium]
MKTLVWDGSGMALVTRRLGGGEFARSPAVPRLENLRRSGFREQTTSIRPGSRTRALPAAALA